MIILILGQEGLMIILILGKKVEWSILEVKTSCFAVLGADESNACFNERNMYSKSSMKLK